MAGNALPILLIGGAALLMMGGKKKKTDIIEPDLPDVVPPPPPSPPPKQGVVLPYWQKAGPPPGGDVYDGPYWGLAGGGPAEGSADARLKGIRQHFADFKYPVDVGPWPMNVLGPAGTLELTNPPGSTPSKGKLGGGDDEPNEVVRKFQKEYNAVSKAKKFAGKEMGGLAPDGLVGPYTLNGLRFVKEKLGARLWPDIVKEAANAGSVA